MVLNELFRWFLQELADLPAPLPDATPPGVYRPRGDQLPPDARHLGCGRASSGSSGVGLRKREAAFVAKAGAVTGSAPGSELVDPKAEGAGTPHEP